MKKPSRHVLRRFGDIQDYVSGFFAVDDSDGVLKMSSQSEDIEYPIPTLVIGIYIVGYKFCLKCTMVY